MSKYKIVVKKTGIGWKLSLYKKYLFLYIIDTISIIQYGFENRRDDRIEEWAEKFMIYSDDIKYIQ